MKTKTSSLSAKRSAVAGGLEADGPIFGNTSLLRAAVLGVAFSLTFGPASPLTPTASAQTRGPLQRTVDGVVHDRNDAVLSGAVVFLKDTKTLAVKSFLSDDSGVFHFGQLSQNTDYEIHAEFDGKRSKNKNISSFDSKNDFHFTLKIDTAKK